MSLSTTHDIKKWRLSRGAAEADTKLSLMYGPDTAMEAAGKTSALSECARPLKVTRGPAEVCAHRPFILPSYLDELLHAGRKNEPVQVEVCAIDPEEDVTELVLLSEALQLRIHGRC